MYWSRRGTPGRRIPGPRNACSGSHFPRAGTAGGPPGRSPPASCGGTPAGTSSRHASHSSLRVHRLRQPSLPQPSGRFWCGLCPPPSQPVALKPRPMSQGLQQHLAGSCDLILQSPWLWLMPQYPASLAASEAASGPAAGIDCLRCWGRRWGQCLHEAVR